MTGKTHFLSFIAGVLCYVAYALGTLIVRGIPLNGLVIFASLIVGSFIYFGGAFLQGLFSGKTAHDWFHGPAVGNTVSFVLSTTIVSMLFFSVFLAGELLGFRLMHWLHMSVFGAVTGLGGSLTAKCLTGRERKETE